MDAIGFRAPPEVRWTDSSVADLGDDFIGAVVCTDQHRPCHAGARWPDCRSNLGLVRGTLPQNSGSQWNISPRLRPDSTGLHRVRRRRRSADAKGIATIAPRTHRADPLQRLRARITDVNVLLPRDCYRISCSSTHTEERDVRSHQGSASASTSTTAQPTTKPSLNWVGDRSVNAARSFVHPHAGAARE